MSDDEYAGDMDDGDFGGDDIEGEDIEDAEGEAEAGGENSDDGHNQKNEVNCF
jgi:hypothetical protein